MPTIRIKDLPVTNTFEGEYIAIDSADGTKKITKDTLFNSFPEASLTSKGLLSSSDKGKLDNLSQNTPLDLSIFVIGETELNGLQDGVNKVFYIEFKIFPEKEVIYLGPGRLVRSIDYSVEYQDVRTKITFTVPPLANDIIHYDAIKG